MKKSSILDKIENYLEFRQEIEGDFLPFESSKPVEKNAKAKKKKKLAFKAEIEKESDLFAGEVVKGVQVDWVEATNLEELREKIKNCQKCPLGASRTKLVFGKGNPDADIMIIGEAPGADEDARGEPFVGRAGQLLTKILEAINLSREEVYIANILKCRPPNNRKPFPSEEDECEPFLQKQIELIQPVFIVALGLTAADRLLRTKHKMAEVHGKFVDYKGVKMLITYHPAALLRNPNLKKVVWEDVKYLRKEYDKFLEQKRIGEK